MTALDEGMEGDTGRWMATEYDAEEADRPTATRSPGLAAGMALCIPTLSLIGLLYSLLK